jgi:uncharacterized protein (UPF0218 family)
MSTENLPSGSDELQVPRRGWILPEAMREQLYMPFGEIVDEESLLIEVRKCCKIITVGDIVTLTLLNKGIKPNLLIFDFKTKREEVKILKGLVEAIDGDNISVKNPPAHISSELIREVREAMHKERRTKIFVDGEEDLATLVCAAYAPKGACLLYGLPDKGVVLVKVNSQISKKAKSLICAMEEWN